VLALNDITTKTQFMGCNRNQVLPVCSGSFAVTVVGGLETHVRCKKLCVLVVIRAVFTHEPKGPGSREANFQGRHIKKIEIEV
jgi:hypothetical protein